MKRDVALWQFSGFATVALTGTILHFLYDWSGESAWIAPFSAVNESTWEHMKLLYVPLLLFATIQHRFFKNGMAFWRIKLIGTIAGLLTIPVLFYTYNGAVGKSPDALNIAIFFIADAVTFSLEAYLFKKEHLSPKTTLLPLTVLLLIGVLFVIFTFAPLPIPLFLSPI